MSENKIEKGYYLNPILPTEAADPSILRDGDDYYMTHSSMAVSPGLLIWHSRDLVNWTPIVRALKEWLGDVWAPDLIKHKDLFYIYFPAGGKNYVITAKSPRGPWSDAKFLEGSEGLIDPGHICDVETGKRYLYFNGGILVELSENGLATVGEHQKLYDSWPFPQEWAYEGLALEGPKLMYKDGWYYFTNADGGTAGPATSHMVISARSKSPKGPWENSPFNPIVHTYSRDEKWASKGHGTIFEAKDLSWWIVFHAYQKNSYPHGRQTLLLPIEWTKDGWFKLPKGCNDEMPIKMPVGEAVEWHDLSDSFSSDKLAVHWGFWGRPGVYAATIDGLVLTAQGKILTEANILSATPFDISYEVEVQAVIEGDATAALALFYDVNNSCGIFADSEHYGVCTGPHKHGFGTNTFKTVWLKILNDKYTITKYISHDGMNFKKLPTGSEISGWHHNSFGSFYSVKFGLFACGDGTVIFKNFKYTAK